MNKTEKEVAIRLTGVSKTYRLGQLGGGTLNAALQTKLAKLRGKEDPNQRLGAGQVPAGAPFHALRGIDLTIYKGETVGIIGSNGAGKSTLLKLLSRVTAPTEGTIELYGRVASMLEVGTGFHGEMTGRENIFLNGAILGMTKEEIQSKLAQIIDFSEIGPFIDTPVKRYSSGMYVRLAFAVAAHLESDILILDEVLAVGDMAFQSKCLRAVGDTKGKTVLYVSHNMQTVRRLCSRCIVLDKGSILYDGDVETAISIYEQRSAGSLQREVALEALPRGEVTHGTKHKMIRFAFETGPELVMGSMLDGTLTIKSSAPEENLCFRCMIYGPDGAPVGMATTKCGSFSPNQGQYSLRMRVDLSMLAPGDYRLKLALYAVSGYGAEALRDVVDDAVFFTVLPSAGENAMPWSRRWWGSVRLPEITVQ